MPLPTVGYDCIFIIIVIKKKEVLKKAFHFAAFIPH